MQNKCRLPRVLQGLKTPKYYVPALGIDPRPLRLQAERQTTTPAMSDSHPMYEKDLISR